MPVTRVKSAMAAVDTLAQNSSTFEKSLTQPGGKSKKRKTKKEKGKGAHPFRHVVSSSESDSGEEQ